MLLKHSLPISQRRLSLLLPLRNILQIRVPRLESTSNIELLYRSIVSVTDAFHASLAVIVAAAEWPDWTLPAALTNDLTAWLAEVLDVLRIESTLEVFDPGDSGE